MSKADNIALARKIYESGTPQAVREILAHDLVWDITPGFPFGGVYHGVDSTFADFFAKLAPLFASWTSEAQEYYGDGENHVFVIGRYYGVTKKGTPTEVRFMHLWTVRDGKLAALKQVADSHLLQLVLDH